MMYYIIMSWWKLSWPLAYHDDVYDDDAYDDNDKVYDDDGWQYWSEVNWQISSSFKPMIIV